MFFIRSAQKAITAKNPNPNLLQAFQKAILSGTLGELRKLTWREALATARLLLLLGETLQGTPNLKIVLLLQGCQTQLPDLGFVPRATLGDTLYQNQIQQS